MIFTSSHPLELDKMERDRTVRDLFPVLVVQLERETSETPSIESDDSVVAFVHESPTPRANTLPQDSDAPQGSDARFDIDPSTTTQHTSVSFDPPSLLVQMPTSLLARFISSLS